MALITELFLNKLFVMRLLQTLDFAIFNFSDPANKVIAIIFLCVQPESMLPAAHTLLAGEGMSYPFPFQAPGRWCLWTASPFHWLCVAPAGWRAWAGHFLS